MIGLKTRFLFGMLVIYIATGLIAMTAFKFVVTQLTENLGSAYASKYALANKSLLQEQLTREIALSQSLADSPVIRSWTANEQDTNLRQQAFAELESYRRRMAGGNWFYIIDSSLHYYVDDGKKTLNETKLVYTLDPANPKDAWYFATVKQVPEYALNVGYNKYYGIQKLWINHVMRDSMGSPIGVVGTGIDLTDFLGDFTDQIESGVDNILIDRRLAIQAHRNRELITHNSVTKSDEQLSTITQLLDKSDEANQLQTVLEKLRNGSKTETMFVNIGGKRQLLGASYLPELEWYVVTILDLDQVIGGKIFIPVFILGLFMTLAVVIVVGWGVNRIVLVPLASLTTAAQKIADGDYSSAIVSERQDEIGALIRTFSKMTATIRTHTEELEDRVRERTAQLDKTNRQLVELNQALQQAAVTDVLTGIPNRRGMLGYLEEEMKQMEQVGSELVLCLIDIDHFKRINDTYGHDVGDVALKNVAAAIRKVLREVDRCARWGGEEFLVIAPGLSEKAAGSFAEKILQSISADSMNINGNVLATTVSIGICSVRMGDTLDDCLKRADEALYAAKCGGRNRWVASEL